MHNYSSFSASMSSLRRGRRLGSLDQPYSIQPEKQKQNEDIDIELVHIIYTRFMQNQPNLVDLGKARLEGFRTFCLPSMVHQTSKNFLWIIHTDPDLHFEVKQELIDLLSPYPNFLLVASNRYPSGFRENTGAMKELLQEGGLLSGDIDSAQMGYEAAQRWPVLETRLDADDGLHNYFVELIQKEEALYLGSQCGIGHVESSWRVWCAYTTIEWHWMNPFSLFDHDHDGANGYVVGVVTPYCQTPGLTVGYCPETSFSDIPAGSHHRIHQLMPECPEDIKTSATGCLKRLKKLSPASIRSRTVTSHGMLNVRAEDGLVGEGYKLLEGQMEKQDDLWTGIEQYMHIMTRNASETKKYMKEHLAAIAADNLKGQCTKGHSCKDSTKTVLKNLAATKT